MSAQAKKPKRPRDLNKLAASIVEDATREDDVVEAKEFPESSDEGPQKDPAAVSLGRKGGLKGGKARAAKLTVEERRAIARHAARVRWSKDK